MVTKAKGSVVTVNEKEAVRAAIKARGMTQQAVAEACGYSRQSNLTRLLASESMKVDSFLMLMDVLQYDVIVRERNANDDANEWKLERIVTVPD